MLSFVTILGCYFAATQALFPKWAPTYQMNSSTIIMTCNYSGYMDQNALKQLAKFGIVDIDWSNAKELWANTAPMDCQERLLAQAETIKSMNPNTKVFVYRSTITCIHHHIHTQSIPNTRQNTEIWSKPYHGLQIFVTNS